MNRLAGALALGCCLLSVIPSRAADAPPGRFVPVEGGQVYYESCGSGPKALLLLHDGLMHSAGFDAVWPALCKRYHVIRYDRRGYGRSPEATSDYSGGDDVLAVLKAVGVSRASVLGASNGGAVALSFALEHPEAVERLILVGADFGLPPSGYAKALARARVGAYLLGGVAGAMAKDRYALTPEHLEARRQATALLVANPQNLNHKDRHRPGPPLLPRLRGIKAPTLVLIGDSDSPDNVASAGALQVLIPGAEREVIKDAGHFIYLEQPEAFVGEVRGFMARATSAEGGGSN